MPISPGWVLLWESPVRVPHLQGLQASPSWDILVEPGREDPCAPLCLSSLLPCKPFSGKEPFPALDMAIRRYLQDKTQMFASVLGVVFGPVVTCVLKKKCKKKNEHSFTKPNKAAMFDWKIGAIIGTSFAVYSYKNSFLA